MEPQPAVIEPMTPPPVEMSAQSAPISYESGGKLMDNQYVQYAAMGILFAFGIIGIAYYKRKIQTLNKEEYDLSLQIKEVRTNLKAAMGKKYRKLKDS